LLDKTVLSRHHGHGYRYQSLEVKKVEPILRQVPGDLLLYDIFREKGAFVTIEHQINVHQEPLKISGIVCFGEGRVSFEKFAQ
jgi:hypothetical protein